MRAFFVQIAVHFFVRGLSHAGSFPSLLMTHTSKLRKMFVPTMPGDELSAVLSIAGAGVGWYFCTNGHPYTVGQCTRPMQTAKCPECGSSIGGKNDVPVTGNKSVSRDTVEKVAETQLKRELTGYMPMATSGATAEVGMFPLPSPLPCAFADSPLFADVGKRSRPHPSACFASVAA